jgi:hypothetical protein
VPTRACCSRTEAVNSPDNLQFPFLHGGAQNWACCSQLFHIEDDVLFDSVFEQIAGLILRSLHGRPNGLERMKVTSQGGATESLLTSKVRRSTPDHAEEP